MTTAVRSSANAPASTAFDALVLDGRLRQALVTVRSLGRRGFSIAALETGKDAPAFVSRWCQRAFASSADLGADRYLTHLESALDTSGARVLIPSHDGTIELLRRHRARLERRVRLAMGEEAALAVAVNKERTLAVATRLGIRVPRGIVVQTISDVPAALTEVGLPAVVKPTESWASGTERGVRLTLEVVTTPDEARRAVASLTRFGGKTLFQELLAGRREAVSFLYANGKVHARFAQWAKRMLPPVGGISTLRQSVAFPRDIGDQAERLIREINLEGYSEVEFRRDAAGVPYLMEINPRLSGSLEIAVRSGVDFPYLLYEWARGLPIDEVDDYRAGVWMRDLHRDLSMTIEALKERGRPGVAPPVQAVVDFGLSFLQPMRYDYVDWSDPLPAAKATADFMLDLARRAVRKTILSLWSALPAKCCNARGFWESVSASRKRRSTAP